MNWRDKNSPHYGGYIDPKDIWQTDEDIRRAVAVSEASARARLITERQRKGALRRIYNRMRKEGHFPDPITEVLK
jgi:hypothetical protein